MQHVAKFLSVPQQQFHLDVEKRLQAALVQEPARVLFNISPLRGDVPGVSERAGDGGDDGAADQDGRPGPASLHPHLLRLLPLRLPALHLGLHRLQPGSRVLPRVRGGRHGDRVHGDGRHLAEPLHMQAPLQQPDPLVHTEEVRRSETSGPAEGAGRSFRHQDHLPAAADSDSFRVAERFDRRELFARI